MSVPDEWAKGPSRLGLVKGRVLVWNPQTVHYEEGRNEWLSSLPFDLSCEVTVTRPAYSTMAEAVEALRRRGFTADFTLSKESGCITAQGHSFKGDQLTIAEHHRFEGISDPDDSSVLYALEASDGTKGLLIDAYGVYADATIGAVLKNTRDDHAGSGNSGT